MSCGCAQPIPGTVCRVRKGIDLPIRTMERFAMCAACPSLSPCGQSCTIDGRPVTEHARQGKCERGRFPTKAGRVRWFGLDWIGVPYPIRLYLRARRGADVSKFPGCGCVRRLKTVWRLQLRRLARYA